MILILTRGARAAGLECGYKLGACGAKLAGYRRNIVLILILARGARGAHGRCRREFGASCAKLASALAYFVGVLSRDAGLTRYRRSIVLILILSRGARGARSRCRHKLGPGCTKLASALACVVGVLSRGAGLAHYRRNIVLILILARGASGARGGCRHKLGPSSAKLAGALTYFVGVLSHGATKASGALAEFILVLARSARGALSTPRDGLNVSSWAYLAT